MEERQEFQKNLKLKEKDKSQQLSDTKMGAIPPANATKHQYSIVLFLLKHEDVPRWNLQPQKEVDNAARERHVMTTKRVSFTHVRQVGHQPEQNPRCGKAKFAKHDPTCYPNLLKQELDLLM